MQNKEQLKERKLFLFNPTSEMAIANGEIAWQPNRMLQQFEKDLEVLPYIFSESQDIIVVHKFPSAQFINSLKALKDIKPTFLLKSKLKNINKISNLTNLSLQPWGWSPAAHHVLKPLKNQTSNSFKNSPNYTWQNIQKEIVSRNFSAEILNKITQNNPTSPYIPKSLQPVICNSINDINQQITKWEQIVLKAPWSASGRGVQMLRQPILNESNKQWISGVIKQQGFIMAEPLLEKLEDFSLQFYIDSNDIKFLEIGKFDTNSNGQYISNTLNPQTQFIEEVLSINTLVQHTQQALKELKIQDHYEGFAGIDLMTVRIENKTLIQPCVEVNWRYNMGLVALQLQKLIHPNSKGKFCLHFNSKQSFAEFASQSNKSNPQEFKNELPFKGFYPLSDPENAEIGAYLILNK